MASGAPVPTAIRRQGPHELHVTWGDGHASQYRNDYLRAHCPCAVCREQPRRTLPLVATQRPRLYATAINLVGRYAVSIEWSDGHDAGIYSYQTLRALCPCPSCAGDAAGTPTLVR